MWMRRRPPVRAGRGTGYEPAYADGGALRAIAAGLSADAVAAVAAVAPDFVADVARPVTRVPVASYPLVSECVKRAPLVRLGFADSSHLDIDPADPWARALLAIAAELLATRRPESSSA
jgi:hypothetical protein